MSGIVTDNINFALNMFRSNIMQYSNENQDGRKNILYCQLTIHLRKPEIKSHPLKTWKLVQTDLNLPPFNAIYQPRREALITDVKKPWMEGYRRRLSVDGQRAWEIVTRARGEGAGNTTTSAPSGDDERKWPPPQLRSPSLPVAGVCPEEKGKAATAAVSVILLQS